MSQTQVAEVVEEEKEVVAEVEEVVVEVVEEVEKVVEEVAAEVEVVEEVVEEVEEVVVVEVEVEDPNLKKASSLFIRLQDDIQIHLMEEYIKPQLRGDDLVREFEKQLNTEECRRLDWTVLVDVVSKIIENKSALAQMYEKYNNIGFKSYYIQHFIQKRNTFTQPSWTPLASFCATLTMCTWH
jgi:hypothetical protein